MQSYARNVLPEELNRQAQISLKQQQEIEQHQNNVSHHLDKREMD